MFSNMATCFEFSFGSRRTRDDQVDPIGGRGPAALSVGESLFSPRASSIFAYNTISIVNVLLHDELHGLRPMSVWQHLPDYREQNYC